MRGPAQCLVGNPISPGSGNKFQVETDYVGVGRFPLEFRRYYNSVDGTWTHTYQQQANALDDDHIELRRDDGYVAMFERNTSGDFERSTDELLTIVDQASPPRIFVTDTSGVEEEYWRRYGYLAAMTSRDGAQITFADSSGQYEYPDSATDEAGRVLSWTYDSSDRLSSMTDPAGNVTTYEYDTSDRLITVVYPDDTPGTTADNPRRTYHYENTTFPNALTGITDERGVRYATWTYDANGRAISSTHAGGADSVTLTYNANGTVTQTNPLGKQSTLHFQDVNGRPVLTQVDGHATAYCGASVRNVTYDANGFMASRTDENGVVTNYTNNARGLRETVTEAVGTTEQRITTTTWHPDHRLPTQIVRPGQTIDMTYDAAGRLLTRTITDTQTQTIPYVTTGNTRTTTWTYNAQGQVATIDGPRTGVSDVTTFTYDANHDLLRTTNALGHVVEILARDARGLPTRIEDANGIETELAYDPRGWLLSTTVKHASGDAVTSYAYDAIGQVTTITLPAGEILSYEYDDARRVTAVENALNERIEYTLDAAGNRLADTYKDPLGAVQRTQTRVFDELSRLIEDIGANSQTVDYGYDLVGNLTSVVDGENNLTTQGFDALNRLISVTDALTNVASYSYDDRDNLVQVTDPAGIVTSYVYDGLDNLIQETSTASGVTTLQYDPAGNVTQRTDARGQVSDTTYDVLNRPLQTTYVGAPGETTTWTYDATAGGNFGVGRLTGFTDPSGSTELTYDHRGNVIDDMRVIDGLSFTTSYAYDLSDNLSSMTYPSGRVVEYTRDAVGRLASVGTRATAGGALVSLANSFSWKPFGPMAGFTHGNGVVTTRTYDQDYRITRILAGSVMDLTYGYDANNNITSITDGVVPARNQTFGYDDLLRLDSATGVYGSITYGYDAVGNRLSRTIVDVGTTTETYTYQTGTHRLTNVAIDDGSTIVNRVMSHTAVGATATDTLATAKTYTWNARNRMGSADVGGTVTDYEYNALGQRVRKVGAENRRYHYDLGGRMIAQSDASGLAVREYLWADRDRFAHVESGVSVYFTHHDHLESVAVLSDGIGSSSAEWVKTPFGVGVTGTLTGVLDTRYPGQLSDDETQLDYNYLRSYDASIGRYVSSDPIGLFGGYNTYAYAQQNPVRFSDPSGLLSLKEARVLGGMVGGAIGSGVPDAFVAVRAASGAGVRHPKALVYTGVAAGLIGAARGAAVSLAASAFSEVHGPGGASVVAATQGLGALGASVLGETLASGIDHPVLKDLAMAGAAGAVGAVGPNPASGLGAFGGGAIGAAATAVICVGSPQCLSEMYFKHKFRHVIGRESTGPAGDDLPYEVCELQQ